MRIRFFIIAMTLILSSCNQEEKKVKDEQFFAVIDNVIDIGKVKQQDLSFAKFKIINTSENEIQVSHLISSCHCTIPNYNSKAVKSKDTLEVNITYDNHVLGFFEQTVSVYFEGKGKSPLLIMRGKIIQ